MICLSIFTNSFTELFFSSLLPWVVIHVLSGASEGNRKPQYKIFVNDIAVATLAPLIALGLYTCHGVF